MLTEKTKSIIKRVAILSAIVIIILIVGILMLKYEVEGEKNMPFNLTKISIVSTVTGEHKEDAEEYWNLNLVQNNDIYLNFQKNEGNLSDVLIKKISLENIEITKGPIKGEVKLYKTSSDISNIYVNKEENLIGNKIEYTGETRKQFRRIKNRQQRWNCRNKMCSRKFGST